MISDSDSSSEGENRGALVPRKESESEESSSGSDSDSDDSTSTGPPTAPPGAPSAPSAPGVPPAVPGAAGALTTDDPTKTDTALVPADDEELPNLEPALSNIQPIPLKKTLMLVNNFIINTTEFMNKFTVLCERKLAKVSQKTTNLEIMLQLLEVKLGSIDWLGGGDAPVDAAVGDATTPTTDTGAPPPPPGGRGPPPPPPGGPGAPPPPPSAPSAAPVEEAGYSGPCLKDDPRYTRFFKMKDMGVPIQALTIKMQSEGVDVAVLDMDPLGPPPGVGAAPSTAVVPVSDDESSVESDLDAD